VKYFLFIVSFEHPELEGIQTIIEPCVAEEGQIPEDYLEQTVKAVENGGGINIKTTGFFEVSQKIAKSTKIVQSMGILRS